MLIRIKDGLIVDHTDIRRVEKGTHAGGAKPLLYVTYIEATTKSPKTEIIFDEAEIARVYDKVNSLAV